VSKIKQFIKSKKTIIENFSYLSFLQIFQLLIPLLIYPYLISVVGSELYGKVIFSQTLIGYCIVFMKYGFDMYATSQIAINVKNKNKLGEIVTSVLFIRLFFLIISFLVLYISIEFSVELQNLKLILLYAFGLCIGEFLFPIWFFLGIEKMKFIAIINILNKIIFLITVFVFIKSKQDYIFIPLLFSLSSVFSGIISLVLVFTRFDIQIVKVSFVEIFDYLKKSTTYFVNSLSIILVEKTNVIILGSFVGMQEVAYYDLANKIIQLAKTPFTILSNVLFPNFSKKLNSSKVKKALLYFTFIGGFIFIMVNLFSKYILLLLGGEEMLEAQKVMFVLSLVLPMVALSLILGLSLAAKGFSKEFMIADLIYLIVYFIVVIVFYFFEMINIYTISIALVIGVLFNTIYKIIKVKKFHIL